MIKEIVRNNKAGLKLTTVFIIVLMICSIISVTLIPNTIVQATNPYAAWTNYKCIRMNVTAGNTTGAGFQVCLNVTYDADMQADFDDIRFTHTDNSTPLYYWIEEKVNSAYCIVWIKINASITSTPSVVTTMYYGNAGVSNNSQINKVWSYYEIWTSNHLGNYTFDDSSGGVDGPRPGYVTTNPIATGITSYRAIIKGAVTYWRTGATPSDSYWGISHSPVKTADDDLTNKKGNATWVYIAHASTGDGATATHLPVRFIVQRNSTNDRSPFTPAVTFSQNHSYLYMLSGSRTGYGSTLNTTEYFTSVNASVLTSRRFTDFPWNTSIYNSYSYEARVGFYNGYISYDSVNQRLCIFANTSTAHYTTVVVYWMVLGAYAIDSFPTITFGTEGTVSGSSSYTLSGLTSGMITWSGTAGQTVWCNSSGAGFETMNITLNVNDIENVTYASIWVGDLNTTTPIHYINASNISIYVSNVSAGPYGLLGTYIDGGNNLTINTTTWNVGTMGTSPFVDSGGITNRTKYIYCRFRLTIPIAVTTVTYNSLTTTAWKVYIGRT